MSATPAMSSQQKIAIVGIGCRFAGGVDNVEEFWKALSEGRDCSSPLPQDRFDVASFYHPDLKKTGKLYCERGGFLKHDVLKFDRQFFKMPPDEAEHLDPQVRLLLEVTQEAFEDAGLPSRSIKGSKTGVFMGVTACEYQSLRASPVSQISQYTNSGTNSCMVSNRISYEYDLNGPSFSVDTACSSSLYTTHLACEAIRRGECNMALAGGVNLLLMPNTFIGFCQAGMLAPDGRCKSFDASADGYSRGEGAGVIVLKPLERALADSDRIYAVIRGGALTNDGHTPGIANPSYDAQVELVRRACANAAVAYADIPYVEAHGTGTQVGDTTEANALGQTIGTARKSRDTPLYIGSVKSNISHCEGSAGIAGVIKTALALQHRQIPPVVHFRRGNEKIKFDEYNLKVPQKLEPWPNKDKALAGVSSFGFGGANAHLVLEGISVDSVNSSALRKERKMAFVKPLVISAQTKEGLTENATRWISHLQKSEESFHDILSTAALRRQHYGHRVGILCRSREDAIAGLEAFVDGSERTRYVDGHVSDTQAGSASRLVFVFNGMGTQWFGMGQALLQAEPVFRETILKFDKVLKTLKCSWSVMEQLENSQFKERIHETEYAQPTICAVQMALTELLKKYDVIPDVVIGHSVGEVAAAYACAKLSFQNAVYVIYERARALKMTSGSGTMLAARVSQQEAEEIRATNEAVFAKVDIAAVNSASQTVLSGRRDALEAFADVLREKGVRNTFLNVQNAFHSSQQEPLRKHVHKKFAKLHRSRTDTDAPSIAMISTVTTDYVSSEQVNSADYWWRNIRYMVHFKDAIERLLTDGYSHFVEIGAHPALMSVIRDVIASSKEKPKKFSVMPTLRRKDDPTSSIDGQFHIMSTLLQLFCEQDHNSLPVVFHDQYRVVSLPTYTWQRGECGQYPSLPKELNLFPIHPLLGRKIPIPTFAEEGVSRKITWHQPAASIAKTPWVGDHVIQGAIVMPAVGYTDMMLEIAKGLQDGDGRLRLRNLSFRKFLFFPTQGDVELLTTASSEPGSDEKLWSVGVWSRSSSAEWMLHASGQIDLRGEDLDEDDQPVTISRGSTLMRLPVEKLRHRCMHETSVEYQEVFDNGFQLGTSFQNNKTICISDDATEALVYADAAKEIIHDFQSYAYHPALFDSLLQGYILMVLFGGKMIAGRRNEPFHYSTEVPYSFGEVELYGEPTEKMVMHIKSYVTDGITYSDIRVADVANNIVFCVLTRVRFDPLPDANNNNALHTWSLSWHPFHISRRTRDMGPYVDKVVVVCDKEKDANQMAEAMKNEGASQVRWVSTRQLDELPKKCHQLTPNDAVVFYLDPTEEDCGQMDADAFARAIDDTCIIATSVLLKIKEAFPDSPPKVWMVTRGAAYVQTGDIPRPCLNTVHSVALTAVHEFYLNPTSSVDLSQDMDLAGDAAILARLVVPPLLPENEFAIRPTDDGETKIVVRRLTKSLASNMKSTSVPWKLPLDGDAVRVIEAQEEINSDFHRPEVDINVEAFSVVVVDGATKAVVCGIVDAGHPEVQFVKPGDKVVALCEGVLKTKIRLSPREVVRVPSNVGGSDAVLSKLNSFLPGLYLCNGGDILRPESKLAIYTQKTSDEQSSTLMEVLRHQGHAVTLFTKKTLKGKDVHGPAEVFDALIALEAESLTDAAAEGLLCSVRKFGTVVMYMTDDKEAVPSRGTLLRNKRLVLLSNSAIWQPDEFSTLATRMFAILEDSDQKALPQFDTRAASRRNQELSVTIGQHYSDVEKGKIVTVIDGKCPVPLSFDGNRFHPNSNAIYIVTGGMKGFGMATVKWLFSKGVKHVAIIGRSEATPEQKSDIAALEEAGCHIYAFKADVSNYKRMEVVIDHLQRKPHPIEGIFHSAVVFRDGWMTEMSHDDWMDVMMPKAYGCLVLHQLSLRKSLPLQHFVTYSSIVGLVGNATQANYCVSNAFLLSLGDLRRSLGLPSSVACFGVINSTGFAYRNELVVMYDKKGMYSVSPKHALDAVATMLSLEIDHLGVTAAFDSKKFAEAFRGAMAQNDKVAGGFLSRFKNILEGVTLGNADGKALTDRIREATPDEGKAMVMAELTSSLAKLLGIKEADVSVDSSPVNLGVDSLMATDLSNNIINVFDIQFLPVELLNDKTTLLSVSHSIYAKVLQGHGTEMGSSNAETDVESEMTQIRPTWVQKVNTPDKVHAQIVCFPPNGGGATNFRNWPTYLEKQGCEMFVVQPPGWEARFTETPVDDLQEMIVSVSRELVPLLKPDRFIFYGHSLGALLAFESAHYLHAKHKLCPRHLYVAAWSAPTIPYQHPPNVPIDVFEPSTPTHVLTSYVPRFTYLDPRLASNPTIMKRLKPCLAAGVKMCSAYTYNHADRLPCNITAFSGSNDLFAPSSNMAGWANMADRKYKYRSKVYRGAHMFLQDPDVSKTVVSKIKANLNKA